MRPNSALTGGRSEPGRAGCRPGAGASGLELLPRGAAGLCLAVTRAGSHAKTQCGESLDNTGSKSDTKPQRVTQPFRCDLLRVPIGRERAWDFRTAGTVFPEASQGKDARLLTHFGLCLAFETGNICVFLNPSNAAVLSPMSQSESSWSGSRFTKDFTSACPERRPRVGVPGSLGGNSDLRGGLSRSPRTNRFSSVPSSPFGSVSPSLGGGVRVRGARRPSGLRLRVRDPKQAASTGRASARSPGGTMARPEPQWRPLSETTNLKRPANCGAFRECGEGVSPSPGATSRHPSSRSSKAGVLT